MPGEGRQAVVEKVTENCVEYDDKKSHVWVVCINNLGPMLFCYVIGEGTYLKTQKSWGYLRIPEIDSPPFFDVPHSFLEATLSKNDTWRLSVERKRDEV